MTVPDCGAGSSGTAWRFGIVAQALRQIISRMNPAPAGRVNQRAFAGRPGGERQDHSKFPPRILIKRIRCVRDFDFIGGEASSAHTNVANVKLLRRSGIRSTVFEYYGEAVDFGSGAG